MLGTSEISLLLLVVIGGITVYYILTDGMSKSNNEKKSEQPKEVDNGQVESIQQEPEVKEVQTKQKFRIFCTGFIDFLFVREIFC